MKQTPKPVQKVELLERNIGIRIAVVAILVAIAVIAFGYGVFSYLNVEKGWTKIEADSGAGANVGNEFVLMYNLGSRSDMSTTAEYKALIPIYTDVMVKAHEQFHIKQGFENVNNVYYINQHPNEEIVVDDMLYQAFETILQYKNRNIYLAPIYEKYDDIFYCEDDAQIVEYDPYLNEEVAEDFKEIASYANDIKAVNVQLCGDNKIILSVSEEYQKYCQQNGITSYIDFSWMKNAFIVDYLAEVLTAQNYTAACISSYDGFVSNLDTSDTEFALNIFNLFQNEVYQAATMQYTSAKNIVTMRNFPINAMDKYRYYVLENGEIRNMYLDELDGLPKSVINTLCSYSEQFRCADILLQISDYYISDTFNQQGVLELSEQGIYSVFLQDKIIFHNDKDIEITGIYQGHSINYITK